MALFIGQQLIGSGVFAYAYGWFDYVVPAGYVTGSGLTLNINASSGSGSQPFYVTPVTVNDGSITSGSLTAAPVGARDVYTTIAPGQVMTTYFDANPSNWPIIAPFSPGNVTGVCGGTNLTWSLDGLSNSEACSVIDGASHPGGQPPGSGWVQIDTAGAGTYGAASYQTPIAVAGPQYWSGGAGFGVGTPNGTKSYKAGDTISLVFFAAQNTFGQVRIYSIRVNAGAGGTSFLSLSAMKVCNNTGGGSGSPPYGDPTSIGTDITPSPDGSFRQWYLGSSGPAETGSHNWGQVI